MPQTQDSKGRVVPRKPKEIKCVFCGKTFLTKHVGQLCCDRSCSAKYKAQQYRDECEKQKVTVWACGGGVESTAIAALIILGAIPKPAYSYMVDCGYEKRRTMEHVYSHLIPELGKAGVTLHIIKPTTNKVMDGNQPAIPMFLKTHDGTDSKLPPRCGHWKMPHAKKWLRAQGVVRCDCLVGISTDEAQRQRQSFSWWYQNRYPLIEMGISRRDCEDIIARIGWPDAPRTSCYLCPNQHNDDWQDMKDNYPDDFQKAIAAEREVQNVNPDLFLHQRCISLGAVDFKRRGQQANTDIDLWFTQGVATPQDGTGGGY